MVTRPQGQPAGQRYHECEYRVKPPPGTEEISCDVCGFGIDRDRTQETEQVVITYTVTGTVYFDPNPAHIDMYVIGTVPAGLNCPFCGSNRYQDGGKRGSL